jgi:hypothetical protein
MKKIVAVVAVLVVAGAGYFWWRSNSSSCCADGCSASHSYSMKMSMICEHSCAAEGVDKSKAVAQHLAKIGDYTQCPVSGVVFRVTDKSSKIEKGEKTAYTCCETCAGMFNESPDDYLANIN